MLLSIGTCHFTPTLPNSSATRCGRSPTHQRLYVTQRGCMWARHTQVTCATLQMALLTTNEMTGEKNEQYTQTRTSFYTINSPEQSPPLVKTPIALTAFSANESRKANLPSAAADDAPLLADKRALLRLIFLKIVLSSSRFIPSIVVWFNVGSSSLLSIVAIFGAAARSIVAAATIATVTDSQRSTLSGCCCWSKRYLQMKISQYTLRFEKYVNIRLDADCLAEYCSL
jgi:hypothetical protein